MMRPELEVGGLELRAEGAALVGADLTGRAMRSTTKRSST
jgi:hypothetical protein